MDVIDQAREYLRNPLTSRVAVEELATIASLSVSHFAALFRQRIGMPALPSQTQLWMAHARELLDTTELPIATVSRHAGYEDAFDFSRQFTSIHHVTPLQCRRQDKG